MYSPENSTGISAPEAVSSPVEQDRIRIAQLIETRFEDNPQPITFQEAEVLLESAMSAVVYAAKDLGYVDETRVFLNSNYHMPRTMPRTTKLNPVFDRPQTLSLNAHPYIRTLHVSQLVVILDTSGPEIHNVVKDLNMHPIMPAGTISSSHHYMNQDRYNKDQILIIRDELAKRLTPPGDLIAEAKLQVATRLSGEALHDIRKKLGIKPQWYKDPETGEGRAYLTQIDAFTMLKYVKDPAYRRLLQDQHLPTESK